MHARRHALGRLRAYDFPLQMSDTTRAYFRVAGKARGDAMGAAMQRIAADPTDKAAEALLNKGAKAVYAYATHGVLSGGAVARVAASPIEKMVITDSIMPTEAVRISPNVKPLSIASLLAEAMKRISEESSVSSLWD